MHIIAAKAVAFGEALRPEFKEYAGQVVANARALAESLVGHGFRIVSGGTDSHLMLVDLRSFGITGRLAQNSLEKANITTNKNAIPNDPEKPFVTSGIRLGTPALTTRGMRESEMSEVAEMIRDVVSAPKDEEVLAKVKDRVCALCARFPIHEV